MLRAAVVIAALGMFADLFSRLEQETMLLETDHNYLFAAVVVDEYDREWLALNQHGGITTAGDRLDRFHDMELSVYPADWDY